MKSIVKRATLNNLRYVEYYSLLFIIGIIFSSCSKENYEAQVPAYISIDQIDLTTNLATEGSASSNITDAWVYVNDNLVGVYELPATFPVLYEGNVSVKIFGGIKDNGIAATRKRYQFYDPHVEQMNLVKGETYKISPHITYNANTKFTWIEDFENASLSFLYTTGSDTIISKSTTDIKEGNFSGHVFLDPGMDFFEATSVGYTSIPNDGGAVYLEMDFKTNELLLIGVYVDGTQYAKVTLNPTTEWKKIYINLTEPINVVPNPNEIKVFMGVKDTPSIPFLTSSPEIYMDNIKLIHY